MRRRRTPSSWQAMRCARLIQAELSSESRAPAWATKNLTATPKDVNRKAFSSSTTRA